MKVRILYAPHGSPLLNGEVYDLADGEALVARGDAEPVKGAAAREVQDDPRPAPEPELDGEADPDAAPAADA